jgi:hypothetical protein
MISFHHGNGKKPSKDKGGQGAELSPLTPVLSPSTSREDAKLVGLAVRKGWKLPEGVMERLPQAMADVAFTKKGTHRNRIAAARVLVSMHGQNQADDPAPQKHEHSGLVSIQAIRDQLTQDNEQLAAFGRSTNGDGEPRTICPPSESG